MKSETYFKKNGFICGVSYKYDFGWTGYVERFDDYEKAVKWLNTEEYDFRQRELCSMTRAKYWIRKMSK